MTHNHDLYQQLIIDHSKSPRNFGKLEGFTHQAEGFNPLCGDHIWVYLKVGPDGVVQGLSFEGSGCAISKASASLMTLELKGKSIEEVSNIFQQFHGLLLGQGGVHTSELPPKLTIFSNIWQYPSRVKCAALSWHTMNGALNRSEKVSTE